MNSNNILFTPLKLGELTLSNRIVMSPMTRSRADENDAPTALNAEYYRQRASAGLIITEGAQPSLNGKGYPRTPGIHSTAQIEGWKDVTDAVHEGGGKIFLQIMHAGRIAHPLNKAANAETVAPSAIKANVYMFTDQQGPVEVTEPRALETNEVSDVIEEYRKATENALAAGFDGVELHAGSGYLPMQFLSSNSNQRTDKYGGSVANRCRFVLDVLAAMCAVAGHGRVGIKIAPGITFNDVQDSDTEETYAYLLEQLNDLDLAYLHVQRPAEFLSEMSQGTDLSFDRVAFVRSHYRGAIIAAGDFTFESATTAVQNGDLELVAFGRYFISNPDLPERFRCGAALNMPDPDRFYSPGPVGYTDYPPLNE